jgi:hypothetical protein
MPDRQFIRCLSFRVQNLTVLLLQTIGETDGAPPWSVSSSGISIFTASSSDNHPAQLTDGPSIHPTAPVHLRLFAVYLKVHLGP